MAKPVIGLVGGIGAGKSAVAMELVALGCERIDADTIGHEMLHHVDVRHHLLARWGQGIVKPDNSVDRQAIAEIVFNDPVELAALNEIMHPLIRDEMQRRLAQAQADPTVIAMVIDAALLFEAGWDQPCTHFIFVSAPDSLRAQRVKQSRGWDVETWRKRENSQFPLDIKRSRCYYSVENSSSLFDLREQVRRVFDQIVHPANPS